MRKCPTCNRPFGGAKRTCFACQRPILKTHRWHIVGCYIIHDDCQNPTMRTLLEPRELTPEAAVKQMPTDQQKMILEGGWPAAYESDSEAFDK